MNRLFHKHSKSITLFIDLSCCEGQILAPSSDFTGLGVGLGVGVGCGFGLGWGLEVPSPLLSKYFLLQNKGVDFT